ncbi:hypothetical protein RRL34_004265 [Vibrio parahaemolyticus]|nr:hypothetical protein [Vibrio parahaemolyticus]
MIEFKDFIAEQREQRLHENRQFLLRQLVLQEQGKETVFDELKVIKHGEHGLVVEATLDGQTKTQAFSLEDMMNTLLMMQMMKLLGRETETDADAVDADRLTTDEIKFLARVEEMRDQTGDESLTDFIEHYRAEPSYSEREILRQTAIAHMDEIESSLKLGHASMARVRILRFSKWLTKTTLCGEFSSGVVPADADLTDEQRKQIELLLQLDGDTPEAEAAIQRMIALVRDPDSDPDESHKLGKITAMIDFYNGSDDTAKRDFAVSTLKTLFGLDVTIDSIDDTATTDADSHSQADTTTDADSQADPTMSEAIDHSAGGFIEFINRQTLNEASTAEMFDYFELTELDDGTFELFATTRNGTEINVIITTDMLMSSAFQSNIQKLSVS